MHITSWNAIVMACLGALVLTGCGGGGGGGSTSVDPDSGTRRAANRVTAEPAGEHCAAGGVRIDTGIDSDRSGALEADEVTGSEFVCNGVAGVAELMAIRAEPAGANCADGGIKVTSGTDSNGDGRLAAAEIEVTRYVCTGATGAVSLVKTSAEATGSHCAWGGTRIDTGVDADDDGLLASGEVGSTAYVCNPPPNAGVVWVDVADTSAQAEPNTGYHTLSGSDTTITLPASSSLSRGDLVSVAGVGSGGWTLAQNAGQKIYGGSLGHLGTVWTPVESNRGWQSIACSSDGSRMAAVEYGGQVYTSSDAGSTWTPRDSNRLWYTIAMTPDGANLVAGVPGGQLYTSTDAGATWTARETPRSWYNVAISADGQTMVAAAGGEQLYTSHDGGVTWTARDSSRLWFSVAVSADGTRMAASEYGGQVYTSTDAGVNWTPRETNRAWAALAMSADGMKLVGGVFGGSIWTSADGGITWQERSSTSNWIALSSSADGRQLLAAASGGQVFTSGDGGATWLPQYVDHNWSSVCVSRDGRTMAALEHGGQIHLSTSFSTPGATGGLRGGQYETIELQYLGDGVFMPLGHEGQLTLF